MNHVLMKSQRKELILDLIQIIGLLMFIIGIVWAALIASGVLK